MFRTDPQIEMLRSVPWLRDVSSRDLRTLRRHGTMLDRRRGEAIGPSIGDDRQLVLVVEGVVRDARGGYLRLGDRVPAGGDGDVPVAATWVTLFAMSRREVDTLAQLAPDVHRRLAARDPEPAAPRPVAVPQLRRRRHLLPSRGAAGSAAGEVARV